MAKLVQFDFPYHGPFGEEMASALRELAESIAKEPGFIWKIWTENSATKEGGGIYLFRDEASARSYINKHTQRLKEFGIGEIRAKLFDVNPGLTSLTNGPVN
jgi:hypothetical protein